MIGFLSLGILSCTSGKQLVLDDLLLVRYQEAIRDAEIAEEQERSFNLIVIPSDSILIWKDSLQPKVLLVTWTRFLGYDSLVGKTTTLSRDVWVTVVPQVREFCTSYHGDKMLRTEQLLGLPPKNERTRFVEFWVFPESVFRPSADPEINDHTAQVDFPAFEWKDSTHRDWYFKRKKESYGANGYPWTRLGYTYDWGNSQSVVGVSEFVIRARSIVEVHRVFSSEEYCAQ